MFRKAVIIGVGQIGASIGMNLVAKKLAREVIGVGRNPRNLREALRRRAIHRVGAIHELPLQGVADLIVLATPVKTIRDLLKKMPKGTLVIDVGSTKSTIVAEAGRRRLRFVGCHPIAGTEVPGAVGAQRDLFRGKVCLMTPGRGVSRSDVKTVRRLWTRLGSKTLTMNPNSHDRLLAQFSHLPHVLAYTLAAQAPATSLPESFSAGLGSFRDATRVAASSPAMWRDIFLENRPYVLQAIDRQVREIQFLRGLIARGSLGGLFRYLSRAQKRRAKIS